MKESEMKTETVRWTDKCEEMLIYTYKTYEFDWWYTCEHEVRRCMLETECKRLAYQFSR